VDGRPAPVLRADAFLQGVPVPAGQHEVRLVYREPAIGYGIWASALVWAVLGGIAVAAIVAARRRDATRRSPRLDA
jgi:hypothetical protein